MNLDTENKILDLEYQKEDSHKLNEGDQKNYRNRLKTFYLYGSPYEPTPPDQIKPLAFEVYTKNHNPTEHLFVYDFETNALKKYKLLYAEVLGPLVEEDLSISVVKKLGSIIPSGLIALQKEEKEIDFESLTKICVEYLKDLYLEIDAEQWEQIEKLLLTRKVYLLYPENSVAFQLLNIQLRLQQWKRTGFIEILNQRISGLEEVLLLNNQDPARLNQSFDFADALVSLDQVSSISSNKKQKISEVRLSRIVESMTILKEARVNFSKRTAFVYASNSATREFGLNALFSETIFDSFGSDSFWEVQEKANEEILQFVRIYKAIKIAELEINQNYQTELHDAYFNNFSLSFLKENELSYFRPFILIGCAEELYRNSNVLNFLLSNKSLVKILSLQNLDKLCSSDPGSIVQESLELVTSATQLQNGKVFQGMSADLIQLNDFFVDGFQSSVPVLWNVLCSNTLSDLSGESIVRQRIARESRLFPSISYDADNGPYLRDKFDVDFNPQVEAKVITLGNTIRVSEDSKIEDPGISMFDAFFSSNHLKKFINILPDNYSDERLLPYRNYNELSEEDRVGKIPFFWMLKENKFVKKAVVPFAWIQFFNSRKKYWEMLKDLAGANDLVHQEVIDEMKTEWLKEKENEFSKRLEELNQEYEQNRKKDLEIAIKNILNNLIGDSMDLQSFVAQAAEQEINVKIAQPEPEAETTNQEIQEIQKVDVSPEVWVESDECTSCSDCIDSLPSVFKYNEDKQAFVHNPKGGPYAKIVAAAEKCPARCIHPGLPHDKNEADLEKWIKRAEKYN